MAKVLTAWIGKRDIEGMGLQALASGPIVSTVRAVVFDRIELLADVGTLSADTFIDWLAVEAGLPVSVNPVSLVSPVHYGSIYEAAKAQLAHLDDQGDDIHVLLSPGTPVMHAVWVLLCKTRYQATLWQSSIEAGVEQVEIPFHISAEYRPLADQISSKGLSDLSLSTAPINAAFDDIVTQNPLMQRLKSQASLLATKSVPVLVYGESGTGKELFSRAIHNASSRSGNPFIALNCGAIPAELVDSVLFGHKKGAFTGAATDHEGVFKQADGGTLFLDEFGELPLSIQVRLLRVLQSGELMPVGATKSIQVDVRIIAATNRDLLQEVAAGRFREDLFYRIAVGVLKLPPLRQRSGDMTLLAESLLAGIYKDLHVADHKKLSADAKNLILKQPWRGNIRELQSTLLRASLWAIDTNITAADIQQALFVMPEGEAGILARDVSQGIDIQQLITEVVRHYIPRAMAESHDNKTKAAELLGLKNYQTLNNWIEKYGIK